MELIERASFDLLTFRLGRADDKEWVSQLCFEVEGSRDYVPHVWDGWLTLPDMDIFVVLLKDVPIALYGLEWNLDGPDSVWVRAMRVKKAMQGKGVASLVMQHAEQVCKQRGRQLLSYSTSNTNFGMIKVSERLGYKYICKNVYWTLNRQLLSQKETLSGNSSLERVVLGIDDVDAAFALIRESDVYAQCAGWYAYGWMWRRLTREAVITHAKADELVGLREGGKLVAVAISLEWVRPYRGTTYYIAFVVGEQHAATHLIRSQIRAYDEKHGAEKYTLQCQAPDHPLVRQILGDLCFANDGSWDEVYRLYVKKVEPEPLSPADRTLNLL